MKWNRQLILKERDRGEVYDRLYVLASKLLRAGNACASCPVESPPRKAGDLLSPARSLTWCCEGCRHTSDTGCTVDALACKLWLCPQEHDAVADRKRVVTLRLAKIKRIAWHYNLLLARGSKEETLNLADPRDMWIIYPNRA